MGAAEEISRHTLVTRGPAADILFEHFSRLFEGRDDVVVVKDRRREQRRREASPVSRERRGRDRRGHGTPWIVPPD
jgi:hypothetical protein